MWTLNFITTKLLRMDEEMLVGSGSHLVGSYKTILPRSHIVEVPHVHQLCNWDCGLACVSMVLRTLGINHCGIHSLAKLCSTTSIWTVDLAYLLHKFSVNFSFLTVTLGANPDFSVETFYKGGPIHGDNKSTIDKLSGLPNHMPRVCYSKQNNCLMTWEEWMDCSKRHLIPESTYRSISGEEISVLILSGKYIAVALVDKYKLSRSWLDDVCVAGCYGGTSGYTGHYIVICGFDADADEFEIRDPASSREHERVSLECLEEARKSFGTDEDILLVSLERKGGGNKL